MIQTLNNLEVLVITIYFANLGPPEILHYVRNDANVFLNGLPNPASFRKSDFQATLLLRITL
jgi:hypothetical protein